MAKAGRLGDRSRVPEDSHSCPECPHDAVGPSKTGSDDVLINDRPALRVGDRGEHADCCGPQLWFAARGAPAVDIGSEEAVRQAVLNARSLSLEALDRKELAREDAERAYEVLMAAAPARIAGLEALPERVRHKMVLMHHEDNLDQNRTRVEAAGFRVAMPGQIYDLVSGQRTA